MQSIKTDFAKFLVDSQVIQFGEFKLKSGRISPYFFNFGVLSSAKLLNCVAYYYARFLNNLQIDVDVIFGPAYKGIPLSVASASAWQREFDRDVAFAFNRKEEKQYGDGGVIVGATLAKKQVVIIDDVMTSGMTTDDSVSLVRKQGGKIQAYLVALDRQEVTLAEATSALASAAERHQLPFYAISNIQHVLEYLSRTDKYKQHVDKISNYLVQYGAKHI
ncbi:MAG: orotate phosphoribosyltransferase [Pseudomonadota bacterium]